MKYRVTDKMPQNREGYTQGMIVEYDPAIGSRLVAKGYIEPADMDEAKVDKMVRHSRRKES